ncbi:MAG: MATE family efflux transporter [Silicimonas sp.]|nr:MATE family efflux transporter [Silicimonas sp.]
MQQTQPLTQPSFAGQARALLGLGLPLVGSHLAQMAIVTTDTVMIGWYSVPALAALSLAGGIWFVIFILGSGFAHAVMPMVATALARDNEREVRRATRMGLWLSILFGVIVTPVFFYFEPIFLAVGQEPDVARLGGDYMVWLGLAMTPALLVGVLRSYFSAIELPMIVLVITLAGAGLNVLFNYALIFGNWGMPEMGIAGAGIASLLGNLLGLVALAICAVRTRPEHELFRNFHRPDWEFLRKVFRLGLPIGLTSFAETGLFTASTIMMGWLGTITLAAHGVALQITALTFMVHIGLSQAITVRAGRAWGRGDRALLRTASLAAMMLSLIFVSLTIAAFLLIPEPLIGLYIDPSDPDLPAILAIGTVLLATAALFQLVDSGQVMALGMLRGVQDTTVPMIMAVISYWGLGLPAGYLLGIQFGLGGAGVWLGLTVGLACACVMMQYRFWTRYTRPI